MQHAAAMRRCLVDLDIPGIRALWRLVSPHLPQMSDEKTLIAMHMARTAAESVPFRVRAYSHKWLMERGHQSQMPDRLKPRAERLYPRIVSAVGISANSKHLVVKRSVQGAMEHAVLDCYANGDEDPAIIKPRMMDARAKEIRGLNHDRRFWR